MVMQKKLFLRRTNRIKRSRYIFCLTMAAIPVLQFCIMWIGTKLQSIVLAFQHYENAAGGTGYDITFGGFDNFVKAFGFFKKNAILFKNSFILFAFTLLIGTTLALVFSFYVYKKYTCSGLFKTVLFMPQVISGLIFATIFRYIVTDGYIFLVKHFTGEQVLGLLDNVDTRFGVIIFFNIWISFSVNVLMYSGAMSGINESVVESAKLDGANAIQEFFHISLPLIYPTLVTFTVMNFAGVFTNMYAVLDLLGVTGANELANVGYWLYATASGATYVEMYNKPTFSVLSACGLILTAILMPITLLVKRFMEKYGPSVD